MIFQYGNAVDPIEEIRRAKALYSTAWDVYQVVNRRVVKLYSATTQEEAYEAQKQAEDIQELTERLVR